MNNQKAQFLVQAIRGNLSSSAWPNMKNAIDGGAPVAALLYGLALIGTMSGFCCTAREGKRYNQFVKDYLSNSLSGCDYRKLDLYKSLRCDMIHGLIPGRPKKGKHTFRLIHAEAQRCVHGTRAADGKVWFHVGVFCSDVLGAARKFLDDVQQALSQKSESTILRSFKARMDKGYTTMKSG